MKNLMKVVLLFAFAAVLSTFAAAETPGIHPAYMHALSNLRAARAHLDRYVTDGRGESHEARAVRAMDAAMRDIREAAIHDRKDPNDRPPADERGDRAGRYRRALELLDSAYRDVDQRESNERNHGLKRSALEHIDDARRAVRHAMEERHGW